MNLFSERKIDKIFYNIMVLIFVLLVVRIIVSNGSAMREIFQHSDLVDSGMDFFNSIICTKDAEPYKVFKTLYPPLANIFFIFVIYVFQMNFLLYGMLIGTIFTC